MSKFDLAVPHHIKPGKSVKLKDLSTGPSDKIDFGKKDAYARIAKNAVEMAELGKRLYAENTRSVLLVLQGMDTAGKDGTIRSVMRGMNPSSCRVTSFKTPTDEELEHDFLWRCHKAAPRHGNIGIFTKIVKCFLHISKETQRERLQARVDDTSKHWKFNLADLDERKLWKDYQDAYEDAIEKCNTDWAPWHIIPSDKKWYRNLVISELLKKTLKDLDPKLPAPEGDYAGIVVE